MSPALGLVEQVRRRRGVSPPSLPEADRTPDPMGRPQEAHHEAAVQQIVDPIATRCGGSGSRSYPHTRTVMVVRYLLALLLLLTASACSAPGAPDQPPAAEGTARQGSAPPATDGRSTAQPDISLQETPPQETAEQVIARLAARIPSARLSIVYNAQTDPNELLGTPNAYVSKAAFTDSRIDPAQASDTETGSIELGGSVEVFIDEADARARKQYLDQTLAELPIDVSEYSYLRGPVLLRLSRRLTPEQAAEYKAALDAP